MKTNANVLHLCAFKTTFLVLSCLGNLTQNSNFEKERAQEACFVFTEICKTLFDFIVSKRQFLVFLYIIIKYNVLKNSQFVCMTITKFRCIFSVIF